MLKFHVWFLDFAFWPACDLQIIIIHERTAYGSPTNIYISSVHVS